MQHGDYLQEKSAISGVAVDQAKLSLTILSAQQ